MVRAISQSPRCQVRVALVHDWIHAVDTEVVGFCGKAQSRRWKRVCMETEKPNPPSPNRSPSSASCRVVINLGHFTCRPHVHSWSSVPRLNPQSEYKIRRKALILACTCLRPYYIRTCPRRSRSKFASKSFGLATRNPSKFQVSLNELARECSTYSSPLWSVRCSFTVNHLR